MKSSQPIKVEIIADHVLTGLEVQVLDRLNHLAGKLKTLESAIAELEAEISSIHEALKNLERSF